jgi:hypothetical protein
MQKSEIAAWEVKGNKDWEALTCKIETNQDKEAQIMNIAELNLNKDIIQ